MYVDSSPVTARRSAGTGRLRSVSGRAARSQTAIAGPRGTAGRRPSSAAARRTRLADAIVSQWLLEQLPSDRRHARTSERVRAPRRRVGGRAVRRAPLGRAGAPRPLAPEAVETQGNPVRERTDGALLRTRHLRARDVDGLDERPDVVRPRARVVLRVPPRGGDPVLRARGRARPRLRTGPLGHRLRDRAELQQAVGGVRPGRPRGIGREGLRRGRGGARVRGPRRARRAGARRGARAPLPGQRPGGRPRRVERRLRRGDA